MAQETFFRQAVRDLAPGSDVEVEVTVEIAINSWGCSAHMGSMSYAGHPAEGPEVEIVKCWLTADEDKANAPMVELTEAERERIELAFLEDPPEPDYGGDIDWDAP